MFKNDRSRRGCRRFAIYLAASAAEVSGAAGSPSSGSKQIVNKFNTKDQSTTGNGHYHLLL
jgi:hypothetical protein